MVDTAGGVKLPHVEALARLRRERERRALHELAALRRREADAEQAREAADVSLATEKDAQQAGERHIYRALRRSGPLQPAGLDRRRETIKTLGDRVDEAAHGLNTSTSALREARQATEAGHLRLIARMHDSRKWRQIETRVRDQGLRRLQARAELDSEDDTQLHYGRSS
ncbi:hypothetical protein I3J27_13380 [Bradyrhizobium xenonodulans]|uniref:Uncharacterized protein n=1 Tax=Bradyrhizobium xenonodulans TaxID=2736875 RepID=A0ABY7MTW3_9BRAD|nr:hypothetical protein [Bradyrhizobium xenonodulans]WBL81361.1 hypothetical protein I3J27_13380 [Bradyrhizobium xenonodulans]